MGVAAAVVLAGFAVAPFAGSAVAQQGPAEIGGFVGGPAASTNGKFTEIADVDVWDGPASDSSDDTIWVLDRPGSRGRVQRLDGDGNFEFAWGIAGIDGPARPTGLAVGPGGKTVYVVEAGSGRVLRFSRDGKPLGGWRVGAGGSAIAVRPVAPFEVFVADEAGAQVLQFSDDGAFVAAWGWGVATGTDRFEACTDRASCRAGLDTGDTLRTGRWPTHLAVDADGIVYGSSLPNAPPSVKLSDKLRTRIVRFRAPGDPPTAEDAESALLPTLQPNAPLTNGTTEGLDTDAWGRLLAITDPFGISVLDVISRPGSDQSGRDGPIVRPLKSLTFLETVSGVAATNTAGVTLVSIGTTDPDADTSSYTGCAQDDAPHDCHGLIVLAPPGASGGVMSPATTGSSGAPTLTAQVAPHGAVTVRFQASRDGQRWRDVGETRQAIGTGYEQVSVDASPLLPGTVYATRLLVGRVGLDGIRWTRSPERVLVTGGRPQSR